MVIGKYKDNILVKYILKFNWYLTDHFSRIHTCLYFIAPTGHSLKSLDLVTMKALVEKGNTINFYFKLISGKF